MDLPEHLCGVGTFLLAEPGRVAFSTKGSFLSVSRMTQVICFLLTPAQTSQKGSFKGREANNL